MNLLTPLPMLADATSHVIDKQVLGEGPWALTMNTIVLIAGFFLFLWVMNVAANGIATGNESEGNARYLTRGRFAQIVEVMIRQLRDQFIEPQLGTRTNRYVPFLLTLFFFIWIMNLIGLVPLIDIQYLAFGYGEAFIGGTPTGRLALNAALALIAFIIWNAFGIKENGIKGWAAHFTGGAPLYLAPLMIPVEILGAFVKPIALTIRLFANMTAGHILLAAIIGFSGMAVAGLGWIAGSPIIVLSLIGGIVIFFFEIFVATLQAFIFMFLTTVFIAQMGHHEHDEQSEEHGEGHDLPQAAALGAA